LLIKIFYFPLTLTINNTMNYQQRLHRLPGQQINPPIILSTLENNKDEKMKNTSVQKDLPLKQGTLSILLADDDADDRELFGEVISETGIKVKLEFAEDGKDLMTMLENPSRELPDIIFLDLNMPNKSGKECLEMIRRSDRLKHIPIVIYSTSSSLNDIDDTFERGANLYVRKPSSYHDLLAMATSVLKINWEYYQPRSSKSNFVFQQRSK
jgi:CheY-like chemotaxis protein